MASASASGSSASAPTGAPDLSALFLLFARGVIATLDLWPALTIAVREQWGGRDSADKKTWIASVLIDEFESRFSPAATEDLPLDEDEIADLLQLIMSVDFDANVEDGSIEAVAADLVRLWRTLLAPGKGAEAEGVVKDMEVRAAKVQKTAHVQATKGQGTEGMSSDEDDDDDEDESDSDDGGMDVDGPPQLVPADAPAQAEPRERAEKVVDDDGFELVQKKGRR